MTTLSLEEIRALVIRVEVSGDGTPRYYFSDGSYVVRRLGYFGSWYIGRPVVGRFTESTACAAAHRLSELEVEEL